MSREIKFRAFIKNEIGGFMIPSEDSDCFMVSNGNGFVVYDENKNTLEDSKFELMQFTGLKDKDGKEIYECDIMKSLSTDIFVVRFINQLACFMLENINPKENFDCILFPLHKSFENIEVIGNIYENPDLLTI